ncbi:HI1506-related protein [Pseudazoarcus pumilus]|uniref:Mu-like prophage FluMu N-terminal domain-containing protein n=1 Tax=Pseudazoarcus pumilus TaxID=2067960 RepID=A0A2I6S9E7_9RHOO|nr:HI1506-related protein [Pseudazoarcus pumilus]AUN95875.1 hypothetical protein C0099_13610 [Pseudazoarcus pumilus]
MTQAKTKSRAASKGAATQPATAPQHTAEGVEPVTTEASGVSPEAGGSEAAAEDLARKAEAVAKPGDDVNDIVAAQRGAPKAGKAAHLQVRALVEGGFRRAGRHWPHEPVTVPAGGFTPEQIEALEAEPLLEVVRVTGEDGA